MVEFHKIRKGDCPWNLAVKELKSRGEKVTNDTIAAEMKRLAQINGCKDTDDFGSFFKVGIEIKLNNTEQNRTEQNRTEQNRTEQATLYVEKTALFDQLKKHKQKTLNSQLLHTRQKSQMTVSSIFRKQYNKRVKIPA